MEMNEAILSQLFNSDDDPCGCQLEIDNEGKLHIVLEGDKTTLPPHEALRLASWIMGRFGPGHYDRLVKATAMMKERPGFYTEEEIIAVRDGTDKEAEDAKEVDL